MQIGTDDVYNCEVQPDKTTFQTVEVVDVELEYEADSCGRVASNVGTLMWRVIAHHNKICDGAPIIVQQAHACRPTSCPLAAKA